MNNLVNKKPGTIMQTSSVFAKIPLANDEMSAGVAVSFPIIGIKSGKWHYRWKGEDTIISDERGFAVPAINVVVVKSQKELSRTFYLPGSYVEGANNRPLCWASDGIKPDDTVPEPISPLCATCPNSAWGSGATPAAPRAQACQQRRRVVVVPYGDDLTNAEQGGPCLLSIPPSSLRNQDEYASHLTENGAHYYAGVTQLSFDQNPNLAFPKIEFSWVQPLTDDEGTTVLGLRDAAQVAAILGSKIATDGPDVGAPARVATSAMPSTPSTGGIPPKPAGVRAPIAPAVKAAPVAAVKAAPAAPVQPALKPKIGGFAIKPSPTPITDAVHAPAAPPPSTRTVRATAEPTVGEALREDSAEGKLPDGLTQQFGDLMNE